MPFPFYQIDAFADGPFTGNPAAVVVLPNAADEHWMQRVAAEMNLSETAFLHGRGDDGFNLRWFTPTIEVALCGHATLASAHALWQNGFLDAGAVARFHTKSGELTAKLDAGLIELNFPATQAEPAEAPPGLLEALGTEATFVGKSRFDYLVEVASEDSVRNLKPDFAGLRTLPVRGVIVTSLAKTSEWDFVSRFFAPAAGVDEDPVTGSAHCTLAPYWSRKLNRNDLTARQVSARGGTIWLTVEGARVRLRGRAVTVVEGRLTA